MYHLVNNLQTRSGDALIGYFVRLKDQNGVYATLYCDENSTPIIAVSGIADTAVTDSEGMYDIYVEDGLYDIEFFDKNSSDTLVDRHPAVPMFSYDTTVLNALVEQSEEAAQAAADALELTEEARDEAGDHAASAAASELASSLNATAAELAAGSTGGRYPDETAFEAGTTNGDIALIVPDGGPAAWWRNDAGNAVLRSVTPNAYAPPFIGHNVGGIFFSPTGVADDAEWARLDVLSEQPSTVIDITDSATRQAMTGVQTSPGTRFSVSVDGDQVVLTNTFAGPVHIAVLACETPITFGDTFEASGVFTNLTGTIAGFVCGFLPAVPTGGGATASIPTDSFAAVVNRQDGFLVDYKRDAISDSPITGHSAETQIVWGEDDVHRFIYRPTNALCTEGTIVWFLNEVPVWRTDIANVPTNSYFCVGVRYGGAGEVARLNKPEVWGKSADIPRTICLDTDALTGDGTLENPAGSPDEVNAIRLRDSSRRSIRIPIKGDALTRGSLQFYAEDYDLIEIAGSPSQMPEIWASKDMSDATWTQISGPYWKTPNPGYLDNNASYGGFYLVGDDWSETYGLNGETLVEGRYTISRLAQDIAVTDPLFEAGCSSVHRTGTHAGNVVLRMPDDSDPNGAPLEWTQYDAAISITARDPGNFTGCTVRISNVRVGMGVLANLIATDVRLELDNVESIGGNGFGLEINRSLVTSYGYFSEGTNFDGIHASADGPAPKAKLRSHFFNTRIRGARFGLSGEELVGGDGVSNHGHNWHEWHFHGGSFASCGKNGVASPGSLYLYNVDISDCVGTCVTLYGSPGAVDEGASEIVIHGGHMKGSDFLLEVNTSSLTMPRTLTVYDAILDTNVSGDTEVRVAVLAYSETVDATSIAHLWDCRRTGPVPSIGGDIADKNNKPGGSFNSNVAGLAYVHTTTPLSGGSPLP